MRDGDEDAEDSRTEPGTEAAERAADPSWWRQGLDVHDGDAGLWGIAGELEKMPVSQGTRAAR